MKKIIFLIIVAQTVSMLGQKIPQPKLGPAPVVKIGKPQTFQLENGLKVIVVENTKLPKVSFNLTIDSPPYTEGNKKGVSNLMEALLGTGSKKISKDNFNESIDMMGAEVDFRANGFTASCLSKFGSKVIELISEVALRPNFTQEEFDKEKAKLIESIKSNEKSVAAIASRVKNVLAFGKNHPSGEYLSESTIKNITLPDVIKDYQNYFIPNNAYLVVVGDVKFEETKKAIEKLFSDWKSATAPDLFYTDPKNSTFPQINYVDMPNAVQSEVAVVNLVNLKMTDPDYFAVLVANQIFGGDFNSYLNMNLREAHGWTYGARSSISGDKYISKFEASTQVRNAVVDSTVVEILKEFKKIRTEKVSEETLQNVKAGYIGRFVMQIEKPQTIAAYALRTETQKLPADFYENYIKNINAVTVDDIQKAANKYFLVDNCKIIVVGKGAEIAKGLENLKMPIYEYNVLGELVKK
jgi:zinc protease